MSGDSLKELLTVATPAERAELEQLLVDRACSEWIISHKAGPMYWLREWTKTENYQWQAQGLEAVMPFPYRPYRDKEIAEKAIAYIRKELGVECELTPDDPPDYLDLTMAVFLSPKVKHSRWPKSREMMTSWSAVGFITWHCQFHGPTEWVSQSEDDRKAQGLIKYGNILYTNQPDWMRALHPLKRGDEGTLHDIEWANGSTYTALPAGPRKLASFHPHGYFSDECAHQAGYKATMDAVMPAVRQTIGISSAGPGEFAIECEA